MIRWQSYRSLVARALVTALMILLLGGCGSNRTVPAANPRAPPVPSVPGAIPQPEHIVLVVFENKAYQQVIGSPAAPYLTALAHTGANFTNAHGERHPSQPNYVALLSGSPHGITDDFCPQHLGNQPNLARQLLDSG